jgi:5-methylcytosine-specific restriction endonuclease McrA
MASACERCCLLAQNVLDQHWGATDQQKSCARIKGIGEPRSQWDYNVTSYGHKRRSNVTSTYVQFVRKTGKPSKSSELEHLTHRDYKSCKKRWEESSRAFMTFKDTQHSANSKWSIVIPTYNRLPILQKCLDALESQTKYLETGVEDYEVVVVDDGSTDGTLEVLASQAARYPHLKLLKQSHAGATAARNLGVKQAVGDTVVFIDSDMVVAPTFLAAHSRSLQQARESDGDDRAFTYGRVVNTPNFEDPSSEKFKVTVRAHFLKFLLLRSFLRRLLPRRS